MVLILEGNSEIGAQVRSNPYYFIYIRHSIRSRTVTNRVSFPKRPIFPHACATCSELPSNMLTISERAVRGKIYVRIIQPQIETLFLRDNLIYLTRL